MTFAASGVILDGKKILLIQRSKNKKHRPSAWALPAGRSEPGETPEQTVVREVKEEVSLDFMPTKIFLEEQGNRFYHYFFLGTWKGEVIPQEEEVDNWGWYSYDEAKVHFVSEKYKRFLKKLREENLSRTHPSDVLHLSEFDASSLLS